MPGKKIRGALIQMNWSVSSYTRDLINTLIESGASMDFITTRQSITPYLDISQIKANTQILLSNRTSLYRLFWKLWRSFSIVNPAAYPVDPVVRNQTIKTLKKSKYDFVIAVEKESLIAAEEALRGTGTRIYYWSLELYNEGHPSYYKYRNLNQKARTLYNKLAGFFIQDQLRWKVIAREVNLAINPFYLPVCVRGDAIEVDKKLIRRRYGIKESVTLLMAHGNISFARGLNSIIDIARFLGEGFVILVHGKLIDNINKTELPQNIIINNQVFSEKELLEFIAMADIGLALYEGGSDNDRLIAYSSHKLAIYARCGLPYIAHNNESFDLIDEAIKWGETLQESSDIIPCVKKIINEYERYHKSACHAYESIYDNNKYAKELIRYLSNPTKPS